MQIIPSMYLFVPDFEKTVYPLLDNIDIKGQNIVSMHWFYGFDLDCDNDTQIKIQDELENRLQKIETTDNQEIFSILVEGVAKEREGFYGLYGGLFFLGILLGIVFIFAAVLIIYYKQISEGYEDQSLF